MAPKHSAKVLSTAPKYKKAVMCLQKKKKMLEKLHSGMNYSVVNCEFNVTEPPICILKGIFKYKQT